MIARAPALGSAALALVLLTATAPLITSAAAPAAKPPAGPPTQQQVRDAERNRTALLQAQRAAQQRAAAAAAEEQLLATQRIAAASALRDLETASAEAADRVADLSRRRAEAEAELAQRAAAMAPFLPVIQRLALYPAETLLAVPMPAEKAVRGILVLGGLTRQLEADASELRAEQAKLAALGDALNQALPELAARQAAQAKQAAVLDAQINAARGVRRAAEGEASESARRAAAEAARADSLRAAIARIAADEAATAARQAAEAQQAQAQNQARQADSSQSRQGATPPQADARPRQEAAARPTGPMSSLVAPVAGTVVRNFGDAVDGGTSSGLSYQVPPAARVVSPCGGRVVFAGPFRSFGLLMIVDCGSGWHVVLSGFERLDAALGQAVQAGEPVGAMPGWDPLTLLRRPSLMLELRRDGQPVNPAPFLRAKG